MINKKSAWFLTLFSLILVLSVYYITMPPELLIAQPNNINKEETSPVVNVEESSILVALRVESDEELDNEINKLKKIVSNSESTIEEKNKAFEKIKDLNNTRSIEETLEKLKKQAEELETEYLKNVSFYKMPEELTKASFKKIYKDDANRVPVLKYITDFIKKYTKDEKVKGLILRVNSGGGSAFASEQIWEALEQFKKEKIHGHVTLRKSERSELAALAAKLL